MNFKNIFFSVALILLICACNNATPEQTAEAKKYIARLKAMNYDDLKNQLKKDTALLNKLIKTSTFNLQLTSHFSSGEKSAVHQSAPEFAINYDKTKVTELFNDYSKDLLFEQNFNDSYNDSTFSLYGQERFTYESRFSLTDDNHIIKEKDSLFKPFVNQVVTDQKTYFFKGKKIAKAAIGLKRIDSIETEVSLKFATDFEKFEIGKNDKKVSYKNFDIEVESIDENMAQLQIPMGLYSDIIAYQAYNNKNLRMNSSALSTTPMLTVDSKITESLKELLSIFADVLEEKDEKSGKEKLNEISQNQLNAKDNMAEFDAYITKLAKDKEKVKELGDVGLYNEIANAGKKVIGTDKQFVVVEFPDDIKAIDVFVGKNWVSLKNKQMVKYGNHYLNPKYFDEAKPNIVFYSHQNDRKFGISNREGEIMIKPAYNELSQLANEYFMGDEKLYWLNVANKKMVALPQFVNFEQSLKLGYDVFEKKIGEENKSGVMLNREKIIIPFEYYGFEKHENFIIAKKDDTDDIYDLNFKKILGKGIEEIDRIDSHIASDISYPSLFVAKGANKKNALVDKNLNLLTGFRYEFIDPFFDVNNYFIVGIRTADGSNYWYGIIDTKGKEVVPFIFCHIAEEFDKNGKLRFCKDGKYQSMDFKSFLEKYKK
ncbi:WG repeat-containing protein [Pedobacter sp. SL55]|uniref:WG repeat-containing protein n=1 Tax=Pedobacter sp. SL55 TaxID=2995161 RepID=UPI0022721AAC|nr:WG repeat-containing protein [Pedobacter sp. SL55]WAC42550.1 WG repeat-containing protein [Pedobacter sp. SL55]